MYSNLQLYLVNGKNIRDLGREERAIQEIPEDPVVPEDPEALGAPAQEVQEDPEAPAPEDPEALAGPEAQGVLARELTILA